MRVKWKVANAAKMNTKQKWCLMTSHRKVMMMVGTADRAREESWMAKEGRGGEGRGGEEREGRGEKDRGERDRGGGEGREERVGCYSLS